MTMTMRALQNSSKHTKDDSRMRCSMVCLLLFFLGIDQQVSSFSNAVFTSSAHQSGATPLRTLLVHNGASPAAVGTATTTFWNKYPIKQLASDDQISSLIADKSFRRHGGASSALEQSFFTHESATTTTSTTSHKKSSTKWTTLLPSSLSISSATAVSLQQSLDVFRTSISTAGQSLSQVVAERYTTSTAAAYAWLLVACTSLSSLSLTKASAATWQACKTLWWAMPLSLCLVPVYCSMVLQTAVGTPHWWKMVEMQYIRDSPDAALVIGFFLLSNICYLFSGLYLLALRHLSSSSTLLLVTTNNNTDKSKKNGLSIISWPLALVTTLLLKATITMPSSSSSSSSSHSSSPSTSTFGENTASSSSSTFSKGTLLAHHMLLQQPRTGLAFWILTSGLVSTIFHSFQAMSGSAESFALAEALCFVDHGVAGASVLYFWNVCGRPRKSTVIVGVAGLVALALPLRPGYAWLHSLWHFLSAAAALLWAFQKNIPAATSTAAAMLVADNAATTTTVPGAWSPPTPTIPETALPMTTTTA